MCRSFLRVFFVNFFLQGWADDEEDSDEDAEDDKTFFGVGKDEHEKVCDRVISDTSPLLCFLARHPDQSTVVVNTERCGTVSTPSFPWWQGIPVVLLVRRHTPLPLVLSSLAITLQSRGYSSYRVDIV